MSYLNIPVVVEYWQYIGTFHGCPDWIEEAIENGTIGRIHNLKAVLDGSQNFIKTPVGNARIEKGDYIVKDIYGNLYPCKYKILSRILS